MEFVVVRTCLTGSGAIFLIPESNIRKNGSRKWKDLQQDSDGGETVENW